MALDPSCERELRVRASPETIFELLTDAKALVSWMGLHARPGRRFELDLGARATARVEHLEVEAPRRVVFRWRWAGDALRLAPRESIVEFELVPDGEHTIVRFRQRIGSPRALRRPRRLSGLAR